MRLAERVAAAAGSLLAVAFAAAGRLRGTRALHPLGLCGSGSLTVAPGPRSGVVLLDDPGPHPCLLRWSRSVGRPSGLDVEGLALRVDGPAAGDVLLSSTGTGTLGRHLLTLRRPHRHGPLTTLLPLSTSLGPLLIRLDPLDDGLTGTPPTSWRLLVSAPARPWHERGRLAVTWTDRDCTRRHDPVGRPPAGSWTHPLWARLRDPSYAAVRKVAAVPTTPEEKP